MIIPILRQATGTIVEASGFIWARELLTGRNQVFAKNLVPG